MKKILLFLAMALAVASLSVAQERKEEGQPERIRVIVFSRTAPFIIAQARGFFAREGIQPEVTFTRNSTEQMRGIIAGTWDIAQTATDNVVAYVESEGADVAIFSGMEKGLKISLFAQPGTTSVKELKGKVLGVDALTTGFTFILRKMMSVNGFEMNRDYQLAAVGGTAQRFQALKEGKVAAVLLNVPFDDMARKAGFPALLSAGDVLDSYMSSVWVGRRSWAAAHRNLLVRYLRAYVASVDWLYDPANRKEAAALLAKDQKIDEAVAEARLAQEMNPAWGVIPKGGVDRKGLEAVMKLRAEAGLLKEPLPPPEKFYDVTYLNEAVKK